MPEKTLTSNWTLDSILQVRPSRNVTSHGGELCFHVNFHPNTTDSHQLVVIDFLGILAAVMVRCAVRELGERAVHESPDSCSFSSSGTEVAGRATEQANLGRRSEKRREVGVAFSSDSGKVSVRFVGADNNDVVVTVVVVPAEEGWTAVLARNMFEERHGAVLEVGLEGEGVVGCHCRDSKESVGCLE